MAQDRLQKLELTWIGKDEPREPLEPRILIENPEYSFGDSESGNMLIHGDNLLALKALEQDFAGRVKCIYIDPPYNTGNAFEHYDDGVEHSIWLSLMRERLVLLHKLLAKDGSIWISIDDDESHYLKVLCDEVFGRRNFVANVIWHKKHTRSNDAKWFSDNHDHILVYAKNKDTWRPNLLPRTEDSSKGYTNPDNDPRGIWASNPCHVKTPSQKCIYTITTPSGREINPPVGRSWMVTKERFQELIDDNRIWFGKNGDNAPRHKKFLSEVQDGFVPLTIWFRDEVGDNQEAKQEVKFINKDEVFGTPKPERLIERVLTLATNEGDLVLDSFLGSGTTAAVAHKMGRRWIGVELGEHAKTHCYPRLKMVAEGKDQGGISKAVNWKGGGGFHFYTLAPSLLKQDRFGNYIINKEYNGDMLAAAMAKQEGFLYSPSAETYWKQGYSSEQDYIYTTTQFLTVESLEAIQETMSEGETLLICCSACQKECKKRFGNITIKKIPQMLLGRCKFDQDDYSLNIINMPQSGIDDEEFCDDESSEGTTLDTPENETDVKILFD